MVYRVYIVTEEVSAHTTVNTFSIARAINVACRKFNIKQDEIHEVTVRPEGD